MNERPYKPFTLNLSITLAYCILIYIQSSLPSPEQMPRIPHLDKLLHFCAYGLLGILFFRSYDSLPIEATGILIPVLAILSSSLYGVSDEIHQHFVPYRSADVWDLLADALGSVTGVYTYRRLLRRLPIPSSGPTGQGEPS